MPLHLQRFSQKSLPSLPSNASLAGTTPLHPDLAQNKVLFGGCVTFHEKQIDSVDDVGGRLRQHSTSKQLLSTWWLEGVSIIVMLACLCAIVVTLKLRQGLPQPEWRQFYGLININALLSVYYTIFKGCMLLVVFEVISALKWAWFRELRPLYDLERFNEASRGPKGAIQLLWSCKGRLRSGVLPMMGALLVIFALLIDPFTQQILFASSDRAHSFYTTYKQFHLSILVTWRQCVGGTGNVQIDLGIEGAIYAGIFGASPVSSAYVPVACPTGKCTFTPYWSLGMCASVRDVTSQVQYNCKGFDWWNATSDHGWNTLAPLCDYTLPIPIPNMPSSCIPTLATSPFDHGWPSLNMTAGSITLGIDLPSIIIMRILRWTTPGESQTFSPQAVALPQLAQGVGAADAQIYPCIRQYNASIGGGIFKEAIIHADGGRSKDFQRIDSVQVSCLSEKEREYLNGKHYNISLDWIAVNGTDFEDIPLHISPKCLYSDAGGVLPGAPQIFQQMWGVGIPGVTDQVHGIDGDFQGVESGGAPDQFQTPPTIQALYDFGNITLESLTTRLDSVADSLTSYMRRIPGDVPDDDKKLATGEV